MYVYAYVQGLETVCFLGCSMTCLVKILSQFKRVTLLSNHVHNKGVHCSENFPAT